MMLTLFSCLFPVSGAAHGLAGILYVLIKCREQLEPGELEQLVLPTLNWLLTTKLENGNYMSSLDSSSQGRLVQWCHGAPGMGLVFAGVHRFLTRSASECAPITTDFLNAAKLCADFTWKYGLLKKGFSLCHGVGGNGYVFLALYHATNDVRYLQKALRFGEFGCELQSMGHHRPADRPDSLLEGQAGFLYYLAELQFDPQNAAFPAFEL